MDAFSRGGAGNGRQTANQSLWFADNFLFGVKKHALKFGGTLKIESQKELSESNRNGTFIFSSLADFQANRPSLFSQILNARGIKTTQTQLGAFVQDDWRIRKNFGLSLGLRYELQNNLSDTNNFSPRIGFSWSPFKKWETMFRGGVGVFYNWFETNHLTTILSESIEQPGETIILNPGFPNPFSSGMSQILPKSYRKKAENLKNPYIFHASIGSNSSIAKNLNLQANYTYQKGIRQFRSRNINAPLFDERPDNNFGNIIQIESSSFFVKHSLKVGFRGNLRKNISYGIDYTLAKKISDSDVVFGLPSDNFNLKADRAPANDDQRHRLFTTLNWIIKRNFQLSAIYSANSPLPYTITTGFDDNGDTNFNDRPFGLKRNSERGKWRNQFDLAVSYLFSFVDRKTKSSGTSAISVSASEANTIFGSTEENKRFSIKTFARVENLFNQANYQTFVGVQTSPLFRQPISAFNARRITFGMRFNF